MTSAQFLQICHSVVLYRLKLLISTEYDKARSLLIAFEFVPVFLFGLESYVDVA